MRRFTVGVYLLIAVLLIGLWAASSALAEEQPRYGGLLRVAIAGDPPSLDMHRESTFKVLIPMAPCYNTLVHFTPGKHPEISCDLCTEWTVSDDHMTYTFKLHKGVTFHDGSPFTSADVKATYEKIIWPPKGVVSVRKTLYSETVEKIETPDPHTVVFRLKYPAASFLPSMAHPANLIYAKKYLDQDMNYYKTHVMGTGPFKLKSILRGSFIELERNPHYWVKGRPYLDGVKYFMIKDLSARAKSIRTGRTDWESRWLSPAEAESLIKHMGDRAVVDYAPIQLAYGVALNVTQKPFDDPRVRKALSLALNRYDMADTIYQLTAFKYVGPLMHPATKWALPPEELQKMPGFGKDYEANLKEAKRLLAEAGYPNGFKTVLTNRAVKLPYIDFGVYVISSWKKIGVEAEHKLEESATWVKNRRASNFAMDVDPAGTITGDPTEALLRWTCGDPNNYGRFCDPRIDELYHKQAREIDEAKRIKLVQEIQRIILENPYMIQGLWLVRPEARSARIRNYKPHPWHWDNRRLQDVWLAEK